MRHVLLAATLASFAGPAAAQCQLGPLSPIDDVALHEQIVEEVPWGYLAPILKGEYGEPYTLVDPLQPRRRALVDNGAKLAVVTPTRGLAVEAYQGGKLYAGRLGPGATLPAVHEASVLRPVLDAVDGSGGESWVVLHETVAGGLPGLVLYRLDGAGKLGAATLLARASVLQARIARLADGRLAVAFAGFAGGSRYRVTTLQLAWLDAKGKPLGPPVRVDRVLGLQPVLDVALAPSGAGIAVAWNPITGKQAGKVESVPVELRAFHLDPGSAPRLTRRDPLSGVVWHIPEAGGILPNQLQAASVDGHAVLLWEQLVNERSMPLFAAPAEGGVATAIVAELPGAPLLRSDGKQLTVMFWDRNGYRHSRATLGCKAAPPGPAPAPLGPQPADPSSARPSRADLDRAWKQLEALAAGAPNAKELLEELHGLKPADRADAEARLSSDSARADGVLDCVLAAHDAGELDACGWP